MTTRTVILLLALWAGATGQWATAQTGGVGVGTAAPNPSAALDVQSTTQGFLLPRLTTAQRNAIAAPAQGLTIFNTDTRCLEFWDGTAWASRCRCYRSCREILTSNPSATTGIYPVDPDCSGPLPEMSAYCDMTTDGGGWTLVLNYLHEASTDPALNVRTTDLPLLGSTTLGTNEGGTAFWGHTSNSLLNAFPFTELRFYSKTSRHARQMHFKTSHAGTLSYFRTGTGTCSGIQAGFTSLAGHTANLPATASSFWVNQGNFAMTNFPFWLGGTHHWGIRALDCGWLRWEVDDCTAICGGPDCIANVKFSTYHQIWIR